MIALNTSPFVSCHIEILSIVLLINYKNGNTNINEKDDNDNNLMICLNNYERS